MKAISSPRHNVNLDITNRHQRFMFFVYPYSIRVHNLLFSGYLFTVLSTKILRLYNMVLYQGMENTLISLMSHKCQNTTNISPHSKSRHRWKMWDFRTVSTNVITSICNDGRLLHNEFFLRSCTLYLTGQRTDLTTGLKTTVNQQVWVILLRS